TAGEDNVQQYVLFPLRSSGFKNPQNADGDAAFEGKKPEFERLKPESEVHVSPSRSAQTKKHDDKTKREAKGKSPIEFSIGYRNLSVEFEDFSDNSINEVNAADSLVPAVGQISTNSTNTFSIAGPSNTVVSPTHGKSSYMDSSQYPDDPNMPAFPIPTTRVHKDHHVTQIIGDLTSANQTRSMTRVVKDQDRKSTSTPIDTKKPLLKDPDGEDVDVHTYRSMIGSLIYLKGKPQLGLWYLKDSPFNLVAYSDSDYDGASLDRKSTTRGCQFLGCRLISWQCKKQTVVATSSTEAEYVAVASCCAQVLWIQNQLLDYSSYLILLKDIFFGLWFSWFWTNNAESIDCLPNEEIFTELSRMGYEKPSTKLTFYKAFFSHQWKFLIHTIPQCMTAKRTSCNEFSSSMASAVICLSTGRKFNFSKYIFDNLVRNVDSSTKFNMYPRFLQLMIKAQVGDFSSHTIKYSSHVLQQKVLANMIRVGKGFSGVETPLFEGMIVAQQAEDVADEGVAGVDVNVVPDDAEPSISSPTPTTQPPPLSQELPSTSQVIPTSPPSPIAEPSSPPQQPPSQPTHNAESSMDLLHTLLETCAMIRLFPPLFKLSFFKRRKNTPFEEKRSKKD
nr:uncharacterized mitochondrial protein AtMg00810-like [Tanacetum cinerariifolium]